MNRVNGLVRRTVFTFVDTEIVKLQIKLIAILLISRLLRLSSTWIVQLQIMFRSLPLKLLAGPARLAFITIIMVIQFPPFPDYSPIKMIINILLQMAMTTIVGISVKAGCGMYPQYCYEGVAEKEAAFETDLLFIILRTVIFVNIAYFIWFLGTGLKRIVLPFVMAAIDFALKEIVTIIILANFITMAIVTQTEDIFIIGIIFNMILCHIMNHFLGLMEHQFMIFLDDYEFVYEAPRRNHGQEIPYAYRNYFRNIFYSEDDLTGVE